MKFSERLKKARKDKGYTQEQLAKIIGVSKQAYRLYEQDRGTPREKVLDTLCEILDVDSHYLFNTEILPFYQELSEPLQVEAVEFTKNKLKEQNEEQKIISLNNSLIPYEVEEEQALSAGYGEGYTQEYGKEVVYWNQQVKHDRAIIIRGNSMEPDYHYGQIALIRYQNCVDVPGGIYAIDDIERGLAYIKSVYMEDEIIRLVSLNDEEDFEGNRLFPDILLPRNENTRIIGKVVDAFTPIEKDFL
ncbi:XRE family transcriptional regulator [Lactococcus lactis]|uniref:XRE family transcriptional regulator n=1 Tax=Lactococcus lactis TaxID=1358 RepID=UPI00288E36C1|nr:XRE family transcriptional regulator [Lactococcus lactis]MDT2887969.1 XRE family transcriptional regulator [Lactococcus lactis]MDT2930749.1 XRE family transcriptional regulator [Lactococcus lactis]